MCKPSDEKGRASNKMRHKTTAMIMAGACAAKSAAERRVEVVNALIVGPDAGKATNPLLTSIVITTATAIVAHTMTNKAHNTSRTKG